MNIRDYESYITPEYGWTGAFEQAVKDMERQGGGTLFIPAGNYSTCSIVLKSNQTLYLSAGAVLSFLDDPSRYPVIPMEYEGEEIQMYTPCIYAENAEYVTVKGEGVIEGNGQRWWKEKDALEHKRPYLVCFNRCCHVKLEGITLLNSPAWTVHPLYCDDVLIHGVRIKNPADSPNTDGINPNSSRNIRISDCIIDVGDDCIAIKAGTEETPNPIPCENITITNCNMVHGHGGIVIGSEMSGCVRNVTVSNCVFQDTDRGIRVKTKRRRGGTVERLLFQNIIMDRVICPFAFNMFYYCGPKGKERYVWDKEPYPVDETTPAIRDIMIQNVVVQEAQAAAGFFYGLPEMPIENVSLSNCVIRMNPAGPAGHPAMMGHMDPMLAEGLFLRNVRKLSLHQVNIEGYRGERILADESADYGETNES